MNIAPEIIRGDYGMTLSRRERMPEVCPMEPKARPTNWTA
jgi:hypothetical protein